MSPRFSKGSSGAISGTEQNGVGLEISVSVWVESIINV